MLVVGAGAFISSVICFGRDEAQLFFPLVVGVNAAHAEGRLRSIRRAGE